MYEEQKKQSAPQAEIGGNCKISNLPVVLNKARVVLL